MDAITIPQNLIKNDDLVIIPRREYEKFLRIFKSAKKTKTQLDKNLDKSIEEIRQGKAIGPFYNAADLMKSLRQET